MDRADRRLFHMTCAAACAVALTLFGCGEESAPKPVAPAPSSPPAAPQAQAKPAPARPETSGAQEAADTALAARVKAALVAEPLLKGHGIDVVAKNGAITLFGTAESKMKLDMAETVAKAVPGVKSVENRLAVVAGS